MALGYDGKLYILAFDHRGSFQKKMFGIQGDPTPEETEKIADAKHLIYEGMVKAADRGGVDPQAAGVLVDEQFGAPTGLPGQAKERGLKLAMPAEKSGQDTFDFQYGDQFDEHIEKFDPAFTKVLVRYNPQGDPTMNLRQTERLRTLSDWLHERGRRFLFELLVPAEPSQLAAVGGDADLFDKDVRPGLMVECIQELQAGGVEPDIWKIEGIDRREDCRRIAETVRRDGRDHVACVVLGRGADEAAVVHWLKQGAGVPGYIGFAIGRTIWWDQLKGYLDGSLTREDAAKQISANYRRAIDVYEGTA